MSSSRKFLAPYSVITNGSMAGNLTSAVTDIRYLDDVCYQIVWTGTPTGTFQVQGSLDQVTWNTLSLTPAPAATGSAGNYLVDLEGLSFPYIRTTYTFTSGTGTLNILVGGKAV